MTLSSGQGFGIDFDNYIDSTGNGIFNCEGAFWITGTGTNDYQNWKTDNDLSVSLSAGKMSYNFLR